MLLCFVWSKNVASSSSGVVCGLISPCMIRDWLLTVSYWCAGEHSCWACYGCVMPRISRLFCPAALTFSLLFFTVFSSHRGGGTDTLFNAKYLILIYPEHPEQSWVSALKTLLLNKEPFLSGKWKKLLGLLTCPQLESLLPSGRSSLLLLVWLLTSFLHKIYWKKAELSYR